MRVQAFIFNWLGAKQHADELERALGPLCPTTVVNSDDARRADRPGWVHLGGDAWFARQWNEALARFDADALFHVQADAWHDDFAAVLRSCESWMERGAGVWAPDVDWTAHKYDLGRLRALGPRAYEVPNTDCTCWAVRSDVLRACPPVDDRKNRFGWGIDYLACAVARRLGLLVVRDYALQVSHEKGMGYEARAARKQFRAMLRSLPRDLRGEVERLVALRSEAIGP